MITNYSKLNLVALGLAAAIFAPAQFARADTITLGASQDATLFNGSTTNMNNSSNDPALFVGTDNSGNAKRGLIQFNLTSATLPPGAVISKVQLQLTEGQSAGGGTTAQTISLFDESEAWGDPTNGTNSTSFNGQGSTANPGDATWNSAFSGTKLWATAGGDWSGSLTDIADNPNVTGTLTSYIWSSTAMITDVQNWMSNPATNFGWIIKNADETTHQDYRAFWTAEGAVADSNSSFAPALIITFSVPEPASIMLLAAAAPCLLLRSRRSLREKKA